MPQLDLFPNGKLLVCSPDFFDVKYEINPWMSMKRRPKQVSTRRQWQTLHHTFLRLGVWLEYIKPLKSTPDMVFTANAGLVFKKRVVLSRFRFKQRQPEAPAFKAWFKAAGYQVLELKTGFFEGAGDAIFAGKTLFCGYGFRTDQTVYPEIKKLLNIPKLVYAQLVNPSFYHLDTCFCPLNSQQAIYYPKAFSVESVREMSKHIELIPVVESEASRFACNAVVIADSVVISAGCPKLSKTLRGLKLNPIAVDLSEFLKGGGSARCLSLRL